MLFPNCLKYDIYSRFQLGKSDQHPGIAFVMTVFPQWHIGKHPGIKIYEPGEVVLVQHGIPFLLQVRQVGEARFGRVWADDLVDVVCVIWKERDRGYLQRQKDCKQRKDERTCSLIISSTFVTFIEILFYVAEPLIKPGELLLSVCVFLFFHLKVRSRQAHPKQKLFQSNQIKSNYDQIWILCNKHLPSSRLYYCDKNFCNACLTNKHLSN